MIEFRYSTGYWILSSAPCIESALLYVLLSPGKRERIDLIHLNHSRIENGTLQKILICKSLTIFNVGINGSGEISYFKTTDHVLRESELVIQRQILSLSNIQECYTLCNTTLELRSTLLHDPNLFQDPYCISILSTNLNSVFKTPCARPCPTHPVPSPFQATQTEAS